MIRGKSKLVAASYLAIVCAVAGCGGTAAYMLDSAASAGSFAAGSQTSAVAGVWVPPENLVKAETYTNLVRIENTGTVDCYVRVFAETADPDMADAVSADWNRDDWTEKQADGYYYYKKILPAGAKTEPLFTEITASENLSSYEMIIYEETVQAAGSDSPQDAFKT